MKKKKYVSKKGKVKKKRKSALESSEEECKTHTGNTGQIRGRENGMHYIRATKIAK